MEWTTNTFDSQGRPWKVTSPDGAVVETNYEAEPIRHIKPMGKKHSLLAYDPENTFDPRQIEFIKQVSSGERSDYFWTKVIPRFEKDVFRTVEPIEIVFLATRHEGKSLLKIIEATHVYLCTVKSADLLFADRLNPDDLSIRSWALVVP